MVRLLLGRRRHRPGPGRGRARTRRPEGPPCTLVTLEGEVFRADGTITGGEREGAAVGALQKKREIAELAAEVARVEERYNEILTRHYTLQKQMGQTEGVLKGLAKNQHAEELNLASQEKDLHKASEDLARVRERLRRAGRARRRSSRRATARWRTRRRTAGARWPTARRTARRARSACGSSRASWSRSSQRAETASAELTACA